MYKVTQPTGDILIADTMSNVANSINKHLGFKIYTGDMVANIMYRPPKKRMRIPGIQINRIRCR